MKGLLAPLTAALVVVSTACSSPIASTAEVVPQRLVVAVGGALPHMDPHGVAGFPSSLPFSAIFDPLVRFDENGKLGPALATEWANVDPTTWRFKLRSGVTFHNGEELTAEAVKVSYDRVLDPNNKLVILNRVGTVSAVKVIDKLTVDIVTKAPDPLLVRNLSEVFILPPAYFKQAGEKGIAEKAIGTGAFEFKELQVGDHITLVASDKSWRGRPKLSEVLIRIIPEASSRLAALKTGEVDVAHNVPLDKLGALEKEGFTVITKPLGRMAAIRLTPGENSPLKDVRVRRAVQHAVDLAAISKNVMSGLAAPAKGQLVGADGFGFDPRIAAYSFDQAKAKQLLTEAGFPSGFQIKFDAPSGINLNDKETAEAVSGFLRQVGIDVQLNLMDQATFADRASGRNIAGRAPMMLYGPNYLPLMDADFPSSFFVSTHRAKLYSNPQYDAIYSESTSTLDTKKREALLHQLGQLLHDDAPVFPLYQIPLVLAASSKVSGLVGRPNETIWFDPISKR